MVECDNVPDVAVTVTIVVCDRAPRYPLLVLPQPESPPMAAQQAITSSVTPSRALARPPCPRRTDLRQGSNPTNGKSIALKSVGDIARSSESRFPMALAIVVDVWIARETFVGPEPAGMVDGVIVAVAPVGKPLTVRVTAAGNVVPPEGPNASL